MTVKFIYFLGKLLDVGYEWSLLGLPRLSTSEGKFGMVTERPFSN